MRWYHFVCCLVNLLWTRRPLAAGLVSCQKLHTNTSSAAYTGPWSTMRWNGNYTTFFAVKPWNRGYAIPVFPPRHRYMHTYTHWPWIDPKKLVFPTLFQCGHNKVKKVDIESIVINIHPSVCGYSHSYRAERRKLYQTLFVGRDFSTSGVNCVQSTHTQLHTNHTTLPCISQKHNRTHTDIIKRHFSVR